MRIRRKPTSMSSPTTRLNIDLVASKKDVRGCKVSASVFEKLRAKDQNAKTMTIFNLVWLTSMASAHCHTLPRSVIALRFMGWRRHAIGAAAVKRSFKVDSKHSHIPFKVLLHAHVRCFHSRNRPAGIPSHQRRLWRCRETRCFAWRLSAQDDLAHHGHTGRWSTAAAVTFNGW